MDLFTLIFSAILTFSGLIIGQQWERRRWTDEPDLEGMGRVRVDGREYVVLRPSVVDVSRRPEESRVVVDLNR